MPAWRHRGDGQTAEAARTAARGRGTRPGHRLTGCRPGGRALRLAHRDELGCPGVKLLVRGLGHGLGAGLLGGAAGGEACAPVKHGLARGLRAESSTRQGGYEEGRAQRRGPCFRAGRTAEAAGRPGAHGRRRATLASLCVPTPPSCRRAAAAIPRQPTKPGSLPAKGWPLRPGTGPSALGRERQPCHSMVGRRLAVPSCRPDPRRALSTRPRTGQAYRAPRFRHARGLTLAGAAPSAPAPDAAELGGAAATGGV